MTENLNGAPPPISIEEIQRNWSGLLYRVGQLEVERNLLEGENKALRTMLERMIDHRQRSHSELVLILSNLVGKLPINDVGVIVSRLVEHNTSVAQALGAMGKGNLDTTMSQPDILRALDQSKRDLSAALKPVVDELIALDPPLETADLRGLTADPDRFFTSAFVRANRCFLKGYLPRERVRREFGDEALVLFQDLTTDPKLNPRPKPDEIVLAFREDFEAILTANPALLPAKREELAALHRRVVRSKGQTCEARAQKNAFQRLSFIIELLHYYNHQGTEPVDLVFAQRLPTLIEQLVVPNATDPLEEKLILLAEDLLDSVIHPDHRLMVVNNLGKSGVSGKTLKYILRLRSAKASDLEIDQVVTEFIRHLIPPQEPPAPAALIPLLRLLNPEMQRLVAKFIIGTDRIRKQDAESLAKVLVAELGLPAFAEAPVKADSPEVERQKAWARIKDLIVRRNDPAGIAAAIRERLHARYDADELRQSWITLTEADTITLIKIFCQLPYQASGKTDPIARTVIETYVSRLTHEKYAATYTKVANSLKSMFHVRPDNATLLNFLALVRWTDPAAANKLCLDIGMPVPG